MAEVHFQDSKDKKYPNMFFKIFLKNHHAFKNSCGIVIIQELIIKMQN